MDVGKTAFGPTVRWFIRFAIPPPCYPLPKAPTVHVAAIDVTITPSPIASDQSSLYLNARRLHQLQSNTYPQAHQRACRKKFKCDGCNRTPTMARAIQQQSLDMGISIIPWSMDRYAGICHYGYDLLFTPSTTDLVASSRVQIPPLTYKATTSPYTPQLESLAAQLTSNYSGLCSHQPYLQQWALTTLSLNFLASLHSFISHATTICTIPSSGSEVSSRAKHTRRVLGGAPPGGSARARPILNRCHVPRACAR